ncbi:MAG: response regulator, partial [Pseudomonadota bacterium]
GGVEAAPTAVGLREFAKAVQATWSVELEASDGPLKIATAPGAVDRLSLDVRRTRQILYALSCALSKRAGKGGLKAVIDAQPKADQTIAYSMTIGFAQGGLSADERDHLEKQVSRSRHVRHPAGEFLGFSVAQKLAAVLGGHVTLLDGQGGGIVRYDADVRRARPELAVNNPNAPRMANFDLGDILLVDANEISQLVVSTALSAAGWRVQAASSAEQAIELINTTSFQAAIVDLMLPRPGGDAFVRALRENQENMTIPRLALAADGSDERRAACLRAGFVDVIEKPIRPRQLVATLADAIMASDAARAAARHSA